MLQALSPRSGRPLRLTCYRYGASVTWDLPVRDRSLITGGGLQHGRMGQMQFYPYKKGVIGGRGGGGGFSHIEWAGVGGGAHIVLG